MYVTDTVTLYDAAPLDPRQENGASGIAVDADGREWFLYGTEWRTCSYGVTLQANVGHVTLKDFPSPEEIGAELASIADFAEPEAEGEPGWADVRLQVWDDGTWAIHTGDASYDQDHRGFWGAGSLASDATESDIAQLAADLLEQALDDCAQADCLDETA